MYVFIACCDCSVKAFAFTHLDFAGLCKRLGFLQCALCDCSMKARACNNQDSVGTCTRLHMSEHDFGTCTRLRIKILSGHVRGFICRSMTSQCNVQVRARHVASRHVVVIYKCKSRIIDMSVHELQSSYKSASLFNAAARLVPAIIQILLGHPRDFDRRVGVI